MDKKTIKNLQEALKGKKLIRVTDTIDQGIDQTVMDIPQEIWYKYPTLGEDFIKHDLEDHGIKCIRPFLNSHRDRLYTYDHLLWKMIADGYIAEMNESPIFFCYKNSTNLDEACSDYGLKQIMPDYKLYKEFQYKSHIEKYGVSEGMGLIPFLDVHLQDTTYEKLAKKFGTRFVVQFSFKPSGWNSFGSRDTTIVESKEDFDQLLETDYGIPAKVSQYIDGMSLCMNVVNTEKGPVTSDLYTQVVGEDELSTNAVALCGSNFEDLDKIPDEVKSKAKQIAKNIGNELYKKNYKGMFGIDFLVDGKTKDVYALEINPRFTGSTMIQTFLLNQVDKLPLIALHFSEYLECLPESFDIEGYEKSIEGTWRGGYFYLRNNENGKRQIIGAPKPGIYKISGNDIEYVSEHYNTDKLPEKDHFLLKQIFPLKRNIDKYDSMAHVFSYDRVFDESNKLTPKFKMANRKLYSMFKFAPADTYDSSVPYKVI